MDLSLTAVPVTRTLTSANDPRELTSRAGFGQGIGPTIATGIDFQSPHRTGRTASTRKAPRHPRHDRIVTAELPATGRGH